jgi:hypothetical protein
MSYHTPTRRTYLQLERLEDRCTPSAMGPFVQPISGQVNGGYSLESSNHTSPAGSPAGNVISTFAVESQGVRVIYGESAIVDGARIVTWALISPRDNTILAVGATFSIKIAEEMPEAGSGPAGAFASLEFPAVVQNTTFFNHLEIQPEPHGHVTPPGSINPDRNSVPHFDFHFYGIPEEEVWDIPALTPPLPAVPAARLPAGYTQPGPSILQMGRHAAPMWSLSDPNPLSTIMIAGYLPDGSQMHFIEPMISQETLLARQDFSLPVPMPLELGRVSSTLYPTKFDALYQGNSYSFVYSDFVTLPSDAAVASEAAATSDVALTDDLIETDTESWLFDSGMTWGIINGHDLIGTTVPPGLLIPVNTFQRSFGYVIMKEYDGEVSEIGELGSLRLQIKLDRLTKFNEALSNVLSLVNDVQAQITSSIK